MNAYILVKLGKEKQGIKSDRAFALANGFSTQNIVDWKAGKSLPNWENMEKLASSADMELWEAVKLMKENSVALKEAGYATLPMMGAIAGLSLVAMTHSPTLAGLIAMSGAATVYYVKSRKRIWMLLFKTFTTLRKYHLNICGFFDVLSKRKKILIS